MASYWQGRPIRQLCCATVIALRFGPPPSRACPELFFQSRSRPRLLRLRGERASLDGVCRAIAGVASGGLPAAVPVPRQPGAVARARWLYETAATALNSPEMQRTPRNKTTERPYPSVLMEAWLASEDRSLLVASGVDRSGRPGPWSTCWRQGAGGGSTLTSSWPGSLSPAPRPGPPPPGGKPLVRKCAGTCSWALAAGGAFQQG